jgi:hypothetical protein
MSSIILWYSVPADEVDHPTTTQLTAWETAAEVDFEAITGVSYDDSTATHVRLFKMLCANYLYYFYKTANRMAASLGMGGASASYQPNVPYFSKQEIESATKLVVQGTSRWYHVD